MDIEEVRRRKAELAALIGAAVRAFESETGAIVDRVDVDRAAPYLRNDGQTVAMSSGQALIRIEIRL